MPRTDDADGAIEMLGDPEVMQFLGGETVPAEDVPVVVGRWLERWEQYGVGPFVIERREDGRFLGRTGILVWDTRTGSTPSPRKSSTRSPSSGGRSPAARGATATPPRRPAPSGIGFAASAGSTG
jgi:hypothetical protein